MAAPTIPVSVEEHLRDPIDIRMDIIHPELDTVASFSTAADLKDSIVKALGFQSDNANIFAFNLKDALVARSIKFDLKVDNKHDVDVDEVKNVILADGAIVTVNGAKCVNLRHPIELPLPFNKTNNDFASCLVRLGNHIQNASRTQIQLISLCIVGPTSLKSPNASFNKLKLKRLSPGLVELSAVPKPNSNNALSTIDLHEHAPTLLTLDHKNTFWPVTSINGLNDNLHDVSAQTFLKIGFGVEKKLTGNESFWEGVLICDLIPRGPEDKRDFWFFNSVDLVYTCCLIIRGFGPASGRARLTCLCEHS
nr:hypothetical protein [Tanacetum cinerariifolium]